MRILGIVAMNLIIVLFLVLIGCAPKAAPVTSPIQAAAVDKAQAKEAWEEEWDRTLAVARKEGGLLVVTDSDPVAVKAVNEGFKKRYGIPVTLFSAGTAQAQGRIMSERRAGLYTMDVFLGGGTTNISLKAAGAFDPIEKMPVLPEVIDPKVWWSGNLEYIDKDRYIIAFVSSPSVPWAINTNLVRPADEPKTWKDLLDPRWKGKIVMRDPRVEGAGSSLFTVVAERQELGMDFWRQFAKQEAMIIRDQRLQVEWLAQGKYSLGTGPTASTVTTFINIGAPLKFILPTGHFALSSASGNIALFNKAPHPNAAKIYINYLLTREAQALYSVASGYQSGRVDVPIDHLDTTKVRQPGAEYIFSSSENFALKTIENRKAAMDIFGQ